MALPESKPEGGEGWRGVQERGSDGGIGLLVVLATTFGRGPARLLVRFIALYYALFFAPARRAVRSFLVRVGEPVGFWRVYRQILRFAQTSLDALFFMRGQLGRFSIDRDGSEHLAKLRDEGRGAILLGAHVGSFYAMRAQSVGASFPVYPLVYTQNARRINAAFEKLDPTSQTRLIQIEDGNMGFMLRVRDLVDEGGIVAILADRVPGSEKTVEVDFLGGRALLPTGPYLLASILKCPVYFTIGIYRDPSTYELRCEPFAERIVLPRGKREEALAEYAQQYANIVERHVRSAPDNWFNFYDFWKAEAS